jgi:hypothetical protein
MLGARAYLKAIASEAMCKAMDGLNDIQSLTCICRDVPSWHVFVRGEATWEVNRKGATQMCDVGRRRTLLMQSCVACTVFRTITRRIYYATARCSS